MLNEEKTVKVDAPDRCSAKMFPEAQKALHLARSISKSRVLDQPRSFAREKYTSHATRHRDRKSSVFLRTQHKKKTHQYKRLSRPSERRFFYALAPTLQRRRTDPSLIPNRRPISRPEQPVARRRPISATRSVFARGGLPRRVPRLRAGRTQAGFASQSTSQKFLR
jgi:hypothetical protein